VDLLGIEPETLSVSIHPVAKGHGYDEYDGQPLLCKEVRPSTDALRFRWEVFRCRMSRTTPKA
jgi:hypothetical protein